MCLEPFQPEHTFAPSEGQIFRDRRNTMRLPPRLHRAIGNDNLQGFHQPCRRLCLLLAQRIAQRLTKQEGCRMRRMPRRS